MRELPQHARIGILLVGVLTGLVAAARPASAQSKSGVPLDLTRPAGDVQVSAGEDDHTLAISGFGVGGYTYDGKTGDNSASAGKLAVSLFREVSDHAYVFGQLTTSVSNEGDGEASTEVEIDNLLVSVTPAGASNLNLTFGTLDAPVGFERDDEVLLFTPSTSFNFELARPSKLTGLFANWTLSRRVELTGLVSNGWDAALDQNHGKTGGVRLGVLPGEQASLGLSALYGSEGEAGESSNRLLLDADYSLEPARGWIIGGEANYGRDADRPEGGDASWSGAMLLVHRQLERHVGLAVRAEVLDDKDGSRTGQPQTLTSWTLAPSYAIGVGREGVFATIQHTSYRIPRLQLRGEVRLNHSNQPFFETSSDELSHWGVQYTMQVVATF